MSTQNLGIVTAYGYAKEKGYTGTLEQFKQLMYDVSQSQGEINRLDGEITDLKEDFTDMPDYGYVPTAGQMMSDNVTVDTEPYSYRATPYGDREIVDGIVGGTVAFNQLANINASSTPAGLTATFDSATGIVTLSGTAITTYGYIASIVNAILDHKYYIENRCVANPNSLTFNAGLTNVSSGSVDQNLSKIITSSANVTTGVGITNLTPNADYTGVKFILQVIDLTQMFGTSVADAIYAMEIATAGSGVAYLKAVAPKMFAQYNPYNAGELMSVSGLSAHETVGFNVWDEEWRVGYYDSQTGEFHTYTSQVANVNPIRVLPNTTYYINPLGVMGGARLVYRDNALNLIAIELKQTGSNYFTTPSNCAYLDFCTMSAYGNTYNHDICINISDPTRNGTYEPYQKHTYALDDSLTLMGFPRWVDGKLTFHGDIYPPSGVLERQYSIVDLGTLSYSAYGSTESYDRYVSSGLDATTKENVRCICPAFVYKGVSSTSAGQIWVGTGNRRLSITTDVGKYSDAAAFKTAMSGVYLVYEKSTPSTETAEPYQSVQVCPNGGAEEYISTSIVPVGHSTRYPENSRAKLDGLPWDFSTLIAPTEEAYKATRNYTTGQLLIVNNILYKVTANIANGGNIVPNTNVTATTLSEVIASL